MLSLSPPNLALPSRPSSISGKPTTDTLFTALNSCTTLTQLKSVHAQILRSNHENSQSLLFKLILLSCDLSPSLDYALSVFDQWWKPETRLCNKFLREVARRGDPERVLVVYEKMRQKGVELDRFSFPPLLKAVWRVCALIEGLEIHGLSLKLGFDTDPFVQTGLVAMYSACGRILEARLVFDKMSCRDVVAWSTMIDGYSKIGLYDDVFQLFEEMKSSNVEPDEVILSNILSACGRAGNSEYGRAIHEFIVQNNIVADPHIQSALVTMYANCGSVDIAQRLFDQMSTKHFVVSTAMVTGYSKIGMVKNARLIFDQIAEKDLVCWSAMISGYAESDWPQEALTLFKQMQLQGIEPDQVTMLSVISACATLGALDQGRWVHMYVKKNGFGRYLPINSALIDMYAKCGSLDGAREVFEKMPSKNVISWTSMISAFAMHGHANDALSLFYKMKDENVEPNWITFVGVLYACSHAGLVEKGKQIFAAMVNDHKIAPKLEHYGCMVDLFGRAKLLREALEVIETMPLPPNVVIWGSLMAACQIHGETELVEFAARRVLELDPDHDGAMVVLSNVYAKEKRWNGVGEMRRLMSQKGISKKRGYSRIELKSEVHEFLMADRSHKQADQIYGKLDEVVDKLKQVGYDPNCNGVLLDVEENEKKEFVLWHSEKLALCYALLNESSSIRIIKNLRICEDCHTFMKLVSKVYGRDIVIRDRSRFHHYKDGVCSCKDYW